MITIIWSSSCAKYIYPFYFWKIHTSSYSKFFWYSHLFFKIFYWLKHQNKSRRSTPIMPFLQDYLVPTSGATLSLYAVSSKWNTIIYIFYILKLFFVFIFLCVLILLYFFTLWNTLLSLSFLYWKSMMRKIQILVG